MAEDRDTPTPRHPSKTWRDRVAEAQELVALLGELSLTARAPLASTRLRTRADRARAVRDLLASYASAFQRWALEPVPYDEKLEDVREFESVTAVARALLAGTTGVPSGGSNP